MSSLSGYLSRMTEDNLFPAGSKDRVTEGIADLEDPTATVLRWTSNGQCPMDDMLAAWVTLGLITMDQAEATSQARAAETARFLAAYRANPPQPSAEELFEMRAAFGPGTKIVNVITGQETQL